MSYLIATLQYALSRKRPHKGKGESALRVFVRRTIGGSSTIDDCGNLIIDRRQRLDGTTSRTLFVAHMDTVHRVDGRNVFDHDREKKLLKANGAPLGADDGAGVAMLVHLLKHGVPGLYVFTVGEEVGGIGAKHFAKTQRELLTTDIDRAIAFDRRGGTSVITHQGFGKCASSEFAEALSEQLSNANDALLYMPDDTGVYTDTAEFVDMVSECTNISVGYAHEHSASETLDMAHFEALAAGVLKIDWDKLPVVRTPGDDGYERNANAWGSRMLDADFDWGDFQYSSVDGTWVPANRKAPRRGKRNKAALESKVLCTREERFQLYDALDWADDGSTFTLCEMLIDQLLPVCKTDSERAELRLLMDEGVEFDRETIDVMYDAADGAPGWEVNAAAHAFAAHVSLWDVIATCIDDQQH